MKLRWPFSPKAMKPVLPPPVEASALPDEDRENESARLGMLTLTEIAKTFEISSRIRDKLADGVLLEVRGTRQ